MNQLPAVPPPQRTKLALLLGMISGTAIGVMAALLSAGALPTPFGQNAVAGAMLGPAILVVLAITVGASAVFGIIGAALRPFALSIGAAVLPITAAITSLWSSDPLARKMVPYAASGVAIAAIVGGIIRAKFERQ